MLSRRSSFKNQTCPVIKKSDATPKPLETAITATAIPSSLPQLTKFPQKPNNFSHHEYGRDLQPLSRAQSNKFTEKTSSFGHHDYSHDHHPLSRAQSTKVTDSVGHQGYGHGHLQPLLRTQSTKVTPTTNNVGSQGYGHGIQSTNFAHRTNSIGHQDHGHDLQPLPRTQSTKVTQNTNSISHQKYGQDLQPLPRTQSAKLPQRTNSVGHHDYGHSSQLALPKKPLPIIEFPVSPELDELVVGEGITNANHPQHKMVHLNLPNPFTCMGCKEYGAGPRFTCQQCNFELHDFCALAPRVLKAHPLHSQHQLLFNPKPGKGGILRSKCDVCGKPTRGYLFHCSACSYQLHPSCAMLSNKMKFPTHPHPLLILPASTNSLLSGDPGELPCAECKRKRSGQVYRCTVCDYYLHAACAKNMVNGLHENGIKGLDKPSVLGVAAKIASHVVVGFMGGLIEGLGEGLGEALSQNFVKGKCNSARKSLYPGN
ncbi:uncharacterized protein LOC141586589 [Silene latifolia]|uniref:uncharacterized protein LOC141586589 n=1 Tax=Silene latifolia TaxID=37657 RepID=UPI003D770019